LRQPLCSEWCGQQKPSLVPLPITLGPCTHLHLMLAFMKQRQKVTPRCLLNITKLLSTADTVVTSPRHHHIVHTGTTKEHPKGIQHDAVPWHNPRTQSLTNPTHSHHRSRSTGAKKELGSKAQRFGDAMLPQTHSGGGVCSGDQMCTAAEAARRGAQLTCQIQEILLGHRD